ncbi:hypothetical protein RFI_13640 [Reticulomyxa filosa]|uniref:FYR N-terminal domain-containing protein n=1 Tax=Reticulomyxa filosa TaxID=46433 RepID=X6NB77_RETFI|nr:hypothetical protein RFI_13640 [Reticulomyxa filosa]|eukprot:ETO23540.1 hypothetical protein RFI_13640 [Reticulomyxa filosa]
MGDVQDLSKTEIDQMLRKGAISIFLKDKETDNEIEKFANASIDEILSTRCEAVANDDENSEADEKNKKVHSNREGAMFSEAHFAANDEDIHINWDAEDFWERVIDDNRPENKDNVAAEADSYPTKEIQAKEAPNVKAKSADNSHNAKSRKGKECSLLEALLVCTYGQWYDIYNRLSPSEKAQLDLHLTKETENKEQEKTENEEQEKTVAPSVLNKTEAKDCISSEICSRLRQAVIETLAYMLQLVKPELRFELLRSREAWLCDPLFVKDAIDTYIDQLFAKKRRRKSAKKGYCTTLRCKRWIDDENTTPLATCCSTCVENSNKFHDVKCDRRYAKQFIWECVEAIKLKCRSSFKSENKGTVRIDEALVRDELVHHPVEVILMNIRPCIIDKEHLKNLLTTKACGDIKAIVQQLEKIFILRGLFTSVLGLDMDCCQEIGKGGFPVDEALDKLRALPLWTESKFAKSMPDWWNKDCDCNLLKGTLIRGWGCISEMWANEHGFTDMCSKRKQWIASKKQISRLGSLVCYFRKAVRTAHQEYHDAQKKKAAAQILEAATVKKLPPVEAAVEKSVDLSSTKKKKKKKPHAKNDENKPDPPCVTPVPLKIAQREILCLGTVEYKNPNYHTKKFIFPIGYKIRQMLPSLQHKNKTCHYTAEIERGTADKEGEQDTPTFVITCEDFAGFRIEDKSSSVAWQKLMNQINEFTRETKPDTSDTIHKSSELEDKTKVENVNTSDAKEEEKTSPITEKENVDLTESKTDDKAATETLPQINGFVKMGLKLSKVIRAVEFLENAEMCKKYEFQFRRVAHQQIDYKKKTRKHKKEANDENSSSATSKKKKKKKKSKEVTSSAENEARPENTTKTTMRSRKRKLAEITQTDLPASKNDASNEGESSVPENKRARLSET